jgi:hypothetical protein
VWSRVHAATSCEINFVVRLKGVSLQRNWNSCRTNNLGKSRFFGEGTAQVSTAPLTSSQIQDAIARGKQFGTRDRYLDSGIKSQKFKLAGAFAGDGISKYLIFFTDYDIVAAATADATHQMREFSDVNARSLPLSGLTLVNVQLHACGDFPVRSLQRHFTGQDLHLVRVDPPIGIRGRHRARKYLRKRGGGPATG